MTATGTVYYVFSGGFSMTTSHGYFDAFTTSSTKYVGAKPYVGEAVSVSGTGSWATSINATTVTQTGTSSAQATATPQPVSGTVIWQAGSATLGKWADANTYQCGSPVQSGSTFSFTLTKDGTSCGRNQAQPETSSGALSTLTPGQVYTWTFGYIDGKPDGSGPGMGDDTEAQSLIFQIHGTGDGATPCTDFGFGNDSSGTQVWQLTNCTYGLSNPYWRGTYTPGEHDTWQITALISTSSSGYIKLYRNGTLVADAPGANYSGVDPWWNFGPYKWRWELSGGGGSDMSTVNATIENMTLTQQ